MFFIYKPHFRLLNFTKVIFFLYALVLLLLNEILLKVISSKFLEFPSIEVLFFIHNHQNCIDLIKLNTSLDGPHSRYMVVFYPAYLLDSKYHV